MKLTPYHVEKLQELAKEVAALVDTPSGLAPAALLPLVHRAFPLLAELKMLDERQKRDELVAQIAASMLPWEAAGDEAAAQLAVTTARQLLAASESYTGGVVS